MNAPQSKVDLHATEVTDILPFNEFGSLDDLDFHAGAFDSAAEILRAPELDDVVDTDEMPLTLMRRMDLNVIHDPDATDIIPRVSGGGLHRKPAASALKGRVMIAAMAAGAAAAAAHTAINPSDEASATAVLSSDVTVPSANAGETPRGMQVVSVTPAAHSSVHSEELAKGVAYAQERAEREARLAAPLFVKPTNGIFTSGFGYRWGALHAGVDIAGPIGTPIYAVSDGVVIEAGPTAGYGALVKLRHRDGTVTLYGHVNTWTVSVGQAVMAGDQIATIGNRGFSTGPHCHFEVMPNGTDRIDPVPWLAQRGISVGGYAG
ncbi:M23 family metallopeptidase [[Mycobacterium] burgundiense]|uniref:M23 family metallopeptidase n=2 Tax=[Mycobacterium] burgundiense TaxID=3064286 RepID=A0ABM9LDB1_9MYCO|nr:M23 family metallopeptidase [Mycolicibacterium sp. MU0053]CAJ1497049.1 M23 family metallopeptidase [Mycolicibacterium sp. MU0053]